MVQPHSATDQEQVVDTMLHELSHNEIGPHNAQFHALWDQLRKEYEGLVSKGYTGEGFLFVEDHCPICAAAAACQGLCRSELAIFRAVLGTDVTVERVEAVLGGDPTNSADGASALGRMRVVDVIQDLSEFARMANHPEPGESMSAFFQGPIDTPESNSHKVRRLNNPFEG